jgi:hypothetical protein
MTIVDGQPPARFALGMLFTVSMAGPVDDVDSLADHVDSVVEELHNLDEQNRSLLDVGVGLDASVREVEIDMTVEADTPEDAAKLALALTRCAIHAAGGGTPGWDNPPLTQNFLYKLQRLQSLERLVDA